MAFSQETESNSGNESNIVITFLLMIFNSHTASLCFCLIWLVWCRPMRPKMNSGIHYFLNTKRLLLVSWTETTNHQQCLTLHPRPHKSLIIKAFNKMDKTGELSFPLEGKKPTDFLNCNLITGPADATCTDKQNNLLEEQFFNLLSLLDTSNLKCKMHFCWAINAGWGKLFLSLAFEEAGRHQSPWQNGLTSQFSHFNEIPTQKRANFNTRTINPQLPYPLPHAHTGAGAPPCLHTCI